MNLRIQRPPAWVLPTLQGLVCFAVTLSLYHAALSLYFVGDDIAFVHPNADWLRAAFVPGGRWHYYPLTEAPFALLAMVSDWRPGPLHLLNLVLHAAVGLGLALCLVRFGIAPWARLLAALFFVSRGIHYEVVIWITELSYLAVALYTLVTLACWDHFLRGHGRRFFWWTVLGFTLAVLTIEHALILAPLCLLYDLFLGRGSVPASGGAPRGASRRRFAPRALFRGAYRYAPFVLIALAFLAIKRVNDVGLVWSSMAPSGPDALATLPSGMDITTRIPPDRNWLGILNSPERCWRDLLAATGYLFLPISLFQGADDSWLTRNPWLCLLPWLGVHIGILWKGRPLARFLLGWIYLYELPLAVAGIPQARYHYLASLPAAALVGIGIQGVMGRIEPGWRRLTVAVLGVALLLAMCLGEARFIRARLREWTLASEMVSAAVNELQRALPLAPVDLYLVNLPRGVPGPFWPAYAFANAAEHLPLMLRPPRPDARVHVVYDRTFVEGRWPTIGRHASRDTLLLQAAAPAAMAYEFLGRPPWLAPLK